MEGSNNLFKVIKRMAYGYRDDYGFFLKFRAAFRGHRGRTRIVALHERMLRARQVTRLARINARLPWRLRNAGVLACAILSHGKYIVSPGVPREVPLPVPC